MFHACNSLVALFVALLLLLGQWLRDQRCRRGWTIEYVAEKLHVDWTTVSRWERNKQTPHERNLQKLFLMYGMNPCDFDVLCRRNNYTDLQAAKVLANMLSGPALQAHTVTYQMKGKRGE